MPIGVSTCRYATAKHWRNSDAVGQREAGEIDKKLASDLLLAVRAQGASAIRAAVFLVLWLTALGFVYLFWHA